MSHLTNLELVEFQEAEIDYKKQLKDRALDDLEKPVKDKTEWWLKKAGWLPILKEAEIHEFVCETITKDDKLRCPEIIEKKSLDLSKLLSVSTIPQAIRERLEWLHKAKLELYPDELSWYKNEIKRWFE